MKLLKYIYAYLFYFSFSVQTTIIAHSFNSSLGEYEKGVHACMCVCMVI